ncbi:hypothetical protein BDQ17DRAFT_1248961, partial [Cyathus striatus]
LGVEKLAGSRLPSYPHSIGTSVWPHDPVMKKPFLRFDWDKKAHHIHNSKPLNEILQYICVNGASMDPLVKPALEYVNDTELKARLTKKFYYMASEWKKVNAGEDTLDEEEETGKSLARANHNTHTQAILNARIQKRALSEYRDLKYDSAFILNAMSDYEDNLNQEKKKPMKYVRRPPDYRSAIVRAVPPISKMLLNHIRAWQVKPELLEENKHWIGQHVAPSGIVWGDEKDPVDSVYVKRV